MMLSSSLALHSWWPIKWTIQVSCPPYKLHDYAIVSCCQAQARRLRKTVIGGLPKVSRADDVPSVPSINCDVAWHITVGSHVFMTQMLSAI